MTKDSVKNLKNIHNRASKKNIIATFALDILMATADTYVAVSQLLEVRVQLAGQRVSFRAVLVRHKSDFLHHISDKYRTNYKKSASQVPERPIFVIRLGFEPKTHSLEGCCSIQLSYRTILRILPAKKAAPANRTANIGIFYCLAMFFLRKVSFGRKIAIIFAGNTEF